MIDATKCPHTNVCSQPWNLIHSSVGLRSPAYTNCLSEKIFSPEIELLWLNAHSILLLLPTIHSFIPTILITFSLLLEHTIVSPATTDPLQDTGSFHVQFCLPRMFSSYPSSLFDASQLSGTGNSTGTLTDTLSHILYPIFCLPFSSSLYLLCIYVYAWSHICVCKYTYTHVYCYSLLILIRPNMLSMPGSFIPLCLKPLVLIPIPFQVFLLPSQPE